jgi:hypothetical protein
MKVFMSMNIAPNLNPSDIRLYMNIYACSGYVRWLLVLGRAECNHCTIKLFLPRNTNNLFREKVTNLPLDAQLRELDVARRGSAI